MSINNEINKDFGFMPAEEYVNDILKFHPDKEIFTRAEFKDYMQWAFYNGVLYKERELNKEKLQQLWNKYMKI